MIGQFSIQNFKCFDALTLDCGALTLLTGVNGGGKSTAIQSLLLLAQGLRSAPSAPALDLNGLLVQLGTAGAVVGSRSDRGVVFSVARADERAEWVFTTDRERRALGVGAAHFASAGGSGASRALRQLGAPIGDTGAALCDQLRTIVSIGAARRAAGDAWPSPPVAGAVHGDVGQDGAYAPWWHFHYGDEEIDPARRHPTEERLTIRGQVDAYLAEIFPSAKVNTDQLTGTGLIRFELRLGTGIWVKPENISYGISYVFPLLIALIVATPGQMVIVDSPEAHLHPRAQSVLGGLLARFANAGVQIMVETHSDHILNGVRLAVKEQLIAPEQARLYFFSGPTDRGHGVVSLRLDRAGEIDDWPPGFFDQAEQDLGRLLGFGT